MAIDYAKQNKDQKIVEFLTKIINLKKEEKCDKSEIEQLTDKNSQLESQINELGDKNSQLESQINELGDKNSHLESQINELADKNSHLESQINELGDKNSQLESQIKELGDKNSQLEVEKQILIDENKLKNVQAQQEIAKLNSFLLALKEKISDIIFINLDDYEEESSIGEGATSSVKIVRKINQDKLAKKELKDLDHKTFKRFLNEAETLFKLRHPCIIRIYGFNYGDKHHPPSIFLSLEPRSLESAINEKILTNEQKSRITVEIVLGMRYIHSRNFMHRDLKPLNILLSKNLHVKISDFGLATEENVSISQSKGVGTLRFMAPELFEESDDDNNTKYTNKVDVYSFGITLIFIMCNVYPKFSLKNASNGILPTLPETIVSWVRELIVRCLSLIPEERPSFEEIFEIMKSNNYDLFNEKSAKLTRMQQDMKSEIENRILKIEAFEYQHSDD